MHIPSVPPGRAGEVFLAFLRLGVTAFGGPVAHLGYFRTEFVERRRWLDDPAYAEVVGLCQMLPGPASSQVGMALGLLRAGWPGMLAAWLAFTLPSAALLILFALGLAHAPGLAGSGMVHGLKVAAVAVVAHAVWSMGRTLCPDLARKALALAAAALALALSGPPGQLLAIAVGAAAGLALPAARISDGAMPDCPVGRRTGAALLAVFFVLLAALPLVAARLDGPWPLIDAFYRTGALVFGGGHVVLPLLEAEVVATGRMTVGDFLAGYGAAQAVPGPLFTFAAYLGALLPAPLGGWGGGLLLLAAVFLPGALLVAGVLPYWMRWRRHARPRQALAGINAAVVGLLLAALYDPIWTGAVRSPADLALAAAAFALLHWGRLSPLWIVAGCALAGAILA